MGFILRLTEVNRYDIPAWIVELSGLTHKDVSTTCPFVFARQSSFTRLARLTGVAASELAALGYSPVESAGSTTEYLFFNSPVPKYFIRTVDNKICPACLRESNHYRKAWDLAGVTVCPAHKLLLLDECQRCRRRIRWNRKGVSVCTCDFDFRDAASHPVVESDVTATSHIYRLCGLPASEDGRGGTGDNPLVGLPLKDYLSLIFFIAGQYENTLDTKGKHVAPRRRNAELHALLSAASSVFESWPRNYFEFLSWRQQNAGRFPEFNTQIGLRKDFGKFYRSLYRIYKDARYDFLRSAFAEYVSRHWEGGYVGLLNRRTLKSLYADDRKYVSQGEARRELGIDTASLDRFIETGRLKAVTRNAGGRRLLFLVEAESVQSLKRELEHSLGLQEAADRMGIVSPTLQRLARRGVIEALRGPTADGSRSWRFGGDVVDDLFNKIRAAIPKPTAALAGDELGLTAALRKIQIRATSVTLADLITDVLNGDISPCGEAARGGLSRFLFKRDVVDAYTNKRRVGRGRSPVENVDSASPIA